MGILSIDAHHDEQSCHAFFDVIPRLIIGDKFDESVVFDVLAICCEPAGDYLYEPNSSIMKAMLFDGIYAQYGDMLKIAPNSHLFFSKNAFLNFPGRIFKIREIALFKKGKSLDTIKGTKANVATRNFPLSASELSRKLKIKDGGETYLFGTTLSTKQTVLLVCEKATF